MVARSLRHVYAAYWGARRLLPPPALKAIADAVAAAELGHLGEICIVIEASLTPLQLMKGMSARERALDVFAQSGTWDTAHNTGVLVYVLVGDRAVEIISDRGLAIINADAWAAIVARFNSAFSLPSTDAVNQGCIRAIAALGELLRLHLPAAGANPDELPDPVRLL